MSPPHKGIHTIRPMRTYIYIRILCCTAVLYAKTRWRRRFERARGERDIWVGGGGWGGSEEYRQSLFARDAHRGRGRTTEWDVSERRARRRNGRDDPSGTVPVDCLFFARRLPIYNTIFLVFLFYRARAPPITFAQFCVIVLLYIYIHIVQVVDEVPHCTRWNWPIPKPRSYEPS